MREERGSSYNLNCTDLFTILASALTKGSIRKPMGSFSSFGDGGFTSFFDLHVTISTFRFKHKLFEVKLRSAEILRTEFTALNI
jgi:hypothetical protein